MVASFPRCVSTSVVLTALRCSTATFHWSNNEQASSSSCWRSSSKSRIRSCQCFLRRSEGASSNRLPSLSISFSTADSRFTRWASVDSQVALNFRTTLTTKRVIASRWHSITSGSPLNGSQGSSSVMQRSTPLAFAISSKRRCARPDDSISSASTFEFVTASMSSISSPASSTIALSRTCDEARSSLSHRTLLAWHFS